VKVFDCAFARILVGVNGSEGAEEAVRQAAGLASSLGADLELAHVFDPTLISRRPVGDSSRDSRHVLDEAERIASKEGVQAPGRVLVGGPASMLVRHAIDRWVDLIALGPDLSFAERPHLLGGVAVHVVRDAACSVLVARPPRTPSRGVPSRIVCAVDGLRPSVWAVEAAVAVARHTEAALRFVRAVPVEAAGNSLGWFVEQRNPGDDVLTEASCTAEDAGVHATRELAFGRPGPAVAAAAIDFGADLIVSGTRGLHGFRRVVGGSVSEWLACHADCSVLVTRPRDRSAHTAR